MAAPSSPQSSEVRRAASHKSTETKSAYKTTELIVWAVTVAAVLIADYVLTNSFGPTDAWRYVTYLSVAYIISRGLAKVGSREPYRD